MNYQTPEQIVELLEYVRWFGGYKTWEEARGWLDVNIDNWREVHDTVIHYK